jgi:hypothetical protein
MKLQKLSEREQAAFGPRTLKQAGSVPWCWQTLNRLVTHYERIEERFLGVEVTLAELRQHQAWNVIPSDQPYGSLDAMLVAEIGLSERALRHQIELKPASPRTSRPIPMCCRPRRREQPGRDAVKQWTMSTVYPSSSNSAERIVRRLKRDRPDIAEALARGEYRSARAAGIEAGFIHVPTPFQQIRRLLPKLSDEDCRTLVDELGERLAGQAVRRPSWLMTQSTSCSRF